MHVHVNEPALIYSSCYFIATGTAHRSSIDLKLNFLCLFQCVSRYVTVSLFFFSLYFPPLFIQYVRLFENDDTFFSEIIHFDKQCSRKESHRYIDYDAHERKFGY